MAYGADGLASLSLTAAVVAALLWLALLALRRLRSDSPAAATRGDCRVMRTLAVGPRERILVVAVGSRQLVVGVGGAAVSLLCELDEPLPAPAAGALGSGLRQAVMQWRR